MRREIPIEEFHPKPTTPTHTKSKIETYGFERWVEKDNLSNPGSKYENSNSQFDENRHSLVSESAKQKALEIISGTHMVTNRANEFFYTRNSDNLNKNNSLSEHNLF